MQRATNEVAALSAAEDRSQPTQTLLAYSNGSVTANGALGSAAAILCIGTHDGSAVVRLASAGTVLSSGRSEWTGLLLVLYIAKHVRGALIVRLGNLQVANAFTDGPWRFRRCGVSQCAVPRFTVPFPMTPPDFCPGRHLSY